MVGMLAGSHALQGCISGIVIVALVVIVLVILAAQHAEFTDPKNN